MPNWCDNRLYVEGPEADIQNILAAVEAGTLLAHMMPEPEYGPEVEGAMPAWWTWRVDNWGTKWEVDAEVVSSEITEGHASAFITFESAWSPPVGAVQHWKSQGEGRIFNLRFIEWGMAFCGEADSDGTVYSVNIPTTCAEAEQVIPTELDQEFGILDCIAQWENEEAEA